MSDRDGSFSGLHPERAIIDIGSNTVRLVVYGGALRAPTTLLNEKVAAQLGGAIADRGVLSDEALDLALRGLKRFALLLDDLGVTEVDVIATAAVREASNSSDFVATLTELGLAPRVVSGEEEATFSAKGVAGAFPGASGIVADLGGGSLELVQISDGATIDPISLPLGTLRLSAYRMSNGSTDAMVKGLAEMLARAFTCSGNRKEKGETLYLVGGTWRAMAVFAMQEEGHPRSDPHGYELDADAAHKLAKRLASSDPEILKSRDRISAMRAHKLPDAAVLLRAMLERFEPENLVFSAWGLREGLLYDSLPDHTQAQDPLLAGVGAFATRRGAPPILAARIAAWTVDVAPSGVYGSERVRLAAIMLALASMQIEPNIRHPQAIEWALHKRWIAVTDAERAMMAAAISANGNNLELPESVTELASGMALKEAMIWGLATRLARRVGARSRLSLQVSRLVRRDDSLILRLENTHRDLFGLSTEKDMALIAGRLGLDWKCEILPVGQSLSDGVQASEVVGKGEKTISAP